MKSARGCMAIMQMLCSEYVYVCHLHCVPCSRVLCVCARAFHSDMYVCMYLNVADQRKFG
jgi:hypothetical protein